MFSTSASKGLVGACGRLRTAALSHGIDFFAADESG